MHTALALLISITMISCSVSKVETISHRGYNDCILISNKTTEVIILPEMGGRVLAYSINDKNIIYRNPGQDGKSFDDFLKERFDPDAGRFDLGPEKITASIHDTIWMGPYEVEINGMYSVKLTSQVSQLMGVQLEREFILDSESSHLIVRQTMINRSNKETNWFFWGRTLVPMGGKLVIPVKPNSNYTQGWGHYVGNPWGFSTENPGHPLVEINDSLLIFKAENTPKAYKFATDANQGWMVYSLNDVHFVKKYEVDLQGVYTDDQTTIVYSHGRNFIEMEPNSPHAFLQPGERYTFDEHWWLIENPADADEENDIPETIRRVLKKATF